mgnify:CR=1 FL=1
MLQRGLILGGLVFFGSLAGVAANAWMQEARKTPEWFTKGVMYQIQVRAFTEEGTLKAAERKLPYLKDLGVTIVYLVPVMKMDTSTDKTYWSPRQIKCGFAKNQYRIADYFHVDEEFGTDQDLKDFCVAAHKLGMKVLFDLVYLHCGPTAPFLREHPDFTWWNEDGTVRKGPYRFPKLNFANPGLRKYFDGNVRYLLTQFGADGFRCDVGDGIPLDFWCDLHDTMDAVTAGHAVLLCEGYTVCRRPIATSGLLLVVRLGDVQSVGTEFADASCRKVLKWGKDMCMEAGRSEISISRERPCVVWALDMAGRRRGQVATTFIDGVLRFVADVAADPTQASFAYELSDAEG